jgi:Spy/CpxP family protein refolding chaperone
MDGMAMPSALPGFPGASHLYHIGATGFFLNHGEHIKLTTEQQTKLNQLKEAALLAKATSERKAAEAEQELWKLTSSGEPDAKMIEEKIREIEKIRGDQRLDFIRAVGEAAGVLTHEQHQALTGKHSSPEDQPDPAVDHSKHKQD